MPKNLITYRHRDTDICVRRYWNKTQLLFDETVVDTWKGFIEAAYAVKGVLEEDVIVADVSPLPVGSRVRLIINGRVVSQTTKM